MNLGELSGPEFVSPVELGRQHVKVRALALAHMRCAVEAKLLREQEHGGADLERGRWKLDVLLDYSVHPTWALRSELQNLRKMIESAGWHVNELDIKNNCGPWLSLDIAVPKPLHGLGGPYR